MAIGAGFAGGWALGVRRAAETIRDRSLGMSYRRLDGGEGLLEAFRALEVDYIFSSPGSEWAPLWEAYAHQVQHGLPGPRYMDVWHETLAVGMAIGYTLATGRMQAVLLHAVPGLLQGAMGLHGALLAETPVLALSSESTSYGERKDIDPGSQWYRNLSIVGGPHSVVDRIVKWSNAVPGVDTLYEFVKRAGELSQRRPAGPVYLNMPVEVLLEEWAPPREAKAVVPAGNRISPESEIRALVDAIRDARSPLIITESVGRDAAAHNALKAFAEAFSIPVIEPQSAICNNFPRSNDLHLGGEPGPLARDSDLILLIRCRAPWYPPSNKPAGARTIVIDETPQRPQVVHQVLFADAYLEGDVADTLREAVRLGEGHDGAGAVRPAVRALRAANEQARGDAETKALANAAAIDPVRLVVALRQAIGDDYVLVDETITHSRLVQQHLGAERQGQYFYVQGGLGQGLGVGLGVKLAMADRLVVVAIGDGAFLYNPIVQALAAARDQGLAVLIVVFNNKRYLSMQFNHLRFYPEGTCKTTGRWFGVDLSSQPELERFGEPFEMHCARVDDPASLDEALAAAVAEVRGGRTAILNVMTSR
jgi:acetolactate synthase-1/2/3 large subunit